MQGLISYGASLTLSWRDTCPCSILDAFKRLILLWIFVVIHQKLLLRVLC